MHPAMVSTAESIAGYKLVRPLGVVRGLVIRSPNFGGAIASAFEQFAGGTNMQQLVALCDRSRADAFLLMLQQAAQLGANAVVGVRYASEDVQSGLVEVVAYGTAVWAEASPA